jgi:hypothetical protein
MYKIEKEVALIANNSHNHTSNLKYPWPQMEIGDSFYVEGYSHKKESALQTVGSAWASRNKPEMKVSVRKEGNGIRVYRTA